MENSLPKLKHGLPAGARYDEGRVLRVLDFMQRLRHTTGLHAGSNFVPLPWQINEVLKPVFGLVDDQGRRIIRTCMVWIPKKNGKSTLAAALALYLLMWDEEPYSEVISAAADKQQARIVYQMAVDIALAAHPSIERTLAIGKESIEHAPSGSRYYAVSSDVKGRHGPNLHGLIFDEIHTQPKRDLWDTLSPAGAARKQALVMGLSTAGVDKESIGYELYDYSRRIVENDVQNPSFHGVIYEAPEEADWTDPKVWGSANPGMGHSVQEDFLRNECLMAQGIPSRQASFKRLHLNMWVQDNATYLPMDRWDRCIGGSVEPEAGAACYGGLDLSSTKDLTAWTLVFPQVNDAGVTILRVQCKIWCPEARLTAKDNIYAAQYRQWAEAGWLTPIPGDRIEYQPIIDQVVKDSEDYWLCSASLDYDWQGEHMAQELQGEGVTIYPFRMGYRSFSLPTKKTEKLISDLRIDHQGNPCLRWQAQNTAITEDAMENVKPNKKESQGRIDSIVALIMAVERWARTFDFTKVDDDGGNFVSFI